jgi:hypothetical protein
MQAQTDLLPRIIHAVALVGLRANHGQIQLFFELPRQRNEVTFTGLNFAARKFPQPGMRFPQWALAQQDFTARVANQGSNNV